MATLIIDNSLGHWGNPGSDFFTDIYVSEHDGYFVSMETAHEELEKLHKEVERLEAIRAMEARCL